MGRTAALQDHIYIYIYIDREVLQNLLNVVVVLQW